jgi:hypothetical protein
MPRNVIPLPEWIPQACELMVKYDLSLRKAAAELGQDISVEDAESIQARKLFGTPRRLAPSNADVAL